MVESMTPLEDAGASIQDALAIVSETVNQRATSPGADVKDLLSAETSLRTALTAIKREVNLTKTGRS